ncbi:ubiquitin-like protein [Coccomyxa subellipsoidea C-169]|uniref:Ubiquitin-like protein n=1 Tax=Coccomyxa subellipsoidea (strain C-169) TaxID=574566 RepID=I0Z3M1_COCSC|nr:ubiquitin-like protein [Coccomyxa subellipsoidea C-169]EIE25240.1 ubiquitin-like protein [Coccomyxa subellipsoidea C-169]|eukprot:XP_005649784.1 ubiquitin-like protein [Coccomyxa subellipsoidea C-169]
MPTFQIVGANPDALEAAVVKYNAASSPFVGQGRKLSDASPAPQQAAPTTAASKGEFEGVDASAPTTTLQIRLADGHRLTGTFNVTHTVADIHRYIRSEQPRCADKQLMSAYPPKPLTDENATLEQAGLLNAVIIQKP